MTLRSPAGSLRAVKTVNTMDDGTLLYNTRLFLAATKREAENYRCFANRIPLNTAAFAEAVTRLKDTNQIAGYFRIHDLDRGLLAAQAAGCVFKTSTEWMTIQLSGLQINKLAQNMVYEDAMDFAQLYLKMTLGVEVN